MLAAAWACLPVHAQEPLGRNLGFENWRGAVGALEDWGMQPNEAYRTSADCGEAPEGRCALRIERIDDKRAGFQPLGQSISAQGLQGRFVKLSGMIRTRDVGQGWAGLWLRVDGAEGRMLKLDNMERTGARGTADWRRFSAEVPVAAGALRIAFGVLLSGTGTAWFDDLRLERGAAAAEVLPRAKPDAALLDDTALALPPEALPKVETGWAEDVRKRHHAIRSLVAEDFSDLQFLKPLLEGKRVVQLGESSHGVAEFNWLKVRLIKFLHQELGYDVVAFESSLSGCAVADERIGRVAPRDVMRDCIFQVWHSNETLGLFEYLEATRKVQRRINLAGFDVQKSGAATREVSRRLVELARHRDDALAAAIEKAEGRVGLTLLDDEVEALTRAYRELAAHLEEKGQGAARLAKLPMEDIGLAIQECRSRQRLIQMRAYGKSTRESSMLRDEGMADNLDFLLDKRYAGRKAIVWAHNYHIAKREDGADGPQAMGAWVDARRGREVYTIGLVMGRGMAATNTRQAYRIDAPPTDTLEGILANAGRRYSFVELAPRDAPAREGWSWRKIVSRSWGNAPYDLIPAATFDAVIYVDTVSIPDYL